MRSPAALARAALRSPSLQTAVVMGAAGIGFAAANLLLARGLSYEEYAVFALVVTFFNVGIPLAPLGADLLLNRRRVRRGGRLLARALATSALTAASLVVVAGWGYELTRSQLGLIFVAVLAGGTNYVAAAHYQSERRFGVSLALVQGINLLMLAAVAATLAAGIPGAWAPLAIVTGGYVVLAVVGWTAILRERAPPGSEPEPFSWTEALSCVGVGGVAILLGQLERLLIPQLLSLEALATFGVLAAIVGSAFRMLWMGVGYSLLPRLRATAEPARRRHILLREARTVSGVMLAASVALWVATPWLVQWLLAGKYLLPPALVFAALVAGVLKVGSAFTRSAATALADNRELARLNLAGWVAVLVAVGASVIGARWGLTGILYGVGVGWLCQGLFAAYIVAPHLREHRLVTPATPERGLVPAKPGITAADVVRG